LSDVHTGESDGCNTNAEKVAAVIARIEAGESERSACESVGIARATFRTTALRHQSGDHYARALYGLAHDQIEKLEQTIEDMRAGTLDPTIGRIEVDARKWFASKFLPKQFGDKIAHVGGDETDNPIRTASKLDITGLNDDQLRALAAIRVSS
jgi:hypothetical protein